MYVFGVSSENCEGDSMCCGKNEKTTPKIVDFMELVHPCMGIHIASLIIIYKPHLTILMPKIVIHVSQIIRNKKRLSEIKKISYNQFVNLVTIWETIEKAVFLERF